MTERNLDTTFPKGAVTGQHLVDDPRLDACADALDGLARRVDAAEGRRDAGIVYNRLLGGWYVVTGPHQTPLNGRFPSREAAQEWLAKSGTKADSLSGDAGPDNTLTTPGRSDADRDPEPSDLWSAIRGLGMTRKTNKELNDLIAEHRGSKLFASRVIVEAARQVMVGKLNRAENEYRGDSSEVRTDPPTSEAQRRFMRWAAENPGESGVSRKVSGEFNEADPGGKLPERKDASFIEAAIRKRRAEKAAAEETEAREALRKARLSGNYPKIMKAQSDLKRLLDRGRSDSLPARKNAHDASFYAGDWRDGKHAVYGADSGRAYCEHDTRADATACAASRNQGSADCS